MRIQITSVYLACALSCLACSSEKKGTAAGANACGIHTQFPGDENCLAVPDPDVGLQIHVGPSSYDDPSVVNAVGSDGKPVWLVEPGDERTQCYRLITSNTEPHNYFKQQYRMRKGSHHLIMMKASDMTIPEGWFPPSDPISEQFCGNIVGAIGGTQSISEDVPPNGVVAPEDEGLYRKLDANAPLDIQLHFYNTTTETHLREAWVNLYYKPDSEATQNLGMLGGFTAMNIKAGTSGSVTGECLSSQAYAPHPVRIVTLFGHAHTHNKRYAVYKDTANGTSELVYDSYEGASSPTFTYNSLVKNPVPNPAEHVTGAASGQLFLADGDKLRFTCDIVNDTQNDFVGLNEVSTDEMCHLFGSVVGAGFPCWNLNGTSGSSTADGGTADGGRGTTDGGTAPADAGP